MTLVLRICLTIILLVGVIIFPWYVELLLVILCIALCAEYYESLFVATVFGIIAGSVYIPIVITGIVFVIVEFVKTKLAFYTQ